MLCTTYERVDKFYKAQQLHSSNDLNSLTPHILCMVWMTTLMDFVPRRVAV